MNKKIIMVMIAVFYSITVRSQAMPRLAAKNKPNIIFILTDDLGYRDLGVFYQQQREKAKDKSEPWMFTPNLDHLAIQGA
ncbi:MAG: hypothetical protein WKF89_19115, partial [Chitinophagaceae bacterium]